MACYGKFPVSAVVYSWVTAGGVMALGAATAVQFGVGVLAAQFQLDPVLQPPVGQATGNR